MIEDGTDDVGVPLLLRNGLPGHGPGVEAGKLFPDGVGDVASVNGVVEGRPAPDQRLHPLRETVLRGLNRQPQRSLCKRKIDL